MLSELKTNIDMISYKLYGRSYTLYKIFHIFNGVSYKEKYNISHIFYKMSSKGYQTSQTLEDIL